MNFHPENIQERLINMIKICAGGEPFECSDRYVDPKMAVECVLHRNGLTAVHFELQPIKGHFEGDRYSIQFPDFGVLSVLTVLFKQKPLSNGDLHSYYVYSFEIESESLSADKTTPINVVKEGYTLTFDEAIRECLLKKGFIRGDRYRSGIYVANRNDILMMVDGNNTHQPFTNMMIYEGALTQKYKLFSVANKKELEME